MAIFFKLNSVIERLISLLKTPIFWLLTLSGNIFVFMGAYLIQLVEGSTNESANSFLNCIIWSLGIITSVGASDFHPQTDYGKILMIIMMMIGSVFLWSYMALFIGVLVGPDLKRIEQDVSEIQKVTLEEDKVLDQIRAILQKTDGKMDSRSQDSKKNSN